MNLEIISYVGAAPFIFGASESEIESLVGKPLSRMKRTLPVGSIELRYPGLSLGFNTNGRLMQVGFDKRFEGQLTLKGIDLMRDADALHKVLILDGDVYEWVGFIMFMGLGIRLGGFHQSVEEGRTVSIFDRGRYDLMAKHFVPYQIEKNSRANQ